MTDHQDNIIDLEHQIGCRLDPKARTRSFFATKPNIGVTSNLLGQLRREAERGGGNVRLCLHQSPEDSLHEMIILQRGNDFFPPKRHPQKAKSFRVLSGMLGVFLFDEAGEVTDAVRLTPDRDLTFRVGANCYFADIPLTAEAIHYEVTSGPFLGPADREMASFGPSLEDAKARKAYRDALLEKLP